MVSRVLANTINKTEISIHIHIHNIVLIGIYTGDSDPEDQALFITEKRCSNDLMTGLASNCSECLAKSPWSMESIIQKGHVIRASYSCCRCHRQKRTWASSRVFGGHYLVNQK